MFGGRFSSASYTALLLLLLFSETCLAKMKASHYCDHPSSCGNLLNISYPFRLKSDPRNCGDPKYELSCEGNRAVLYFHSGKYYVQAINYNNSTIRIVDAGLKRNDCSSIPMYSLTKHNFSHSSYYTYGDSTMVFLTCQNEVNSPLSVDTASCTKEVKSSNSSFSHMERHSYVLFGRKKMSDVPNMCTIKTVITVPFLSQRENYRSLSYSDIHNYLLFGLEISWELIYCQHCKERRSGDCVVDDELNVTGYSLFCSALGLSFLHILSAAVDAIYLNLAARILFGMPCVIAFLIYKLRRRHLSIFDAIEGFLRSQNNLMPINYSFSDIKKMTKGFKDKLGEGGYGSVYKGKLRSGQLVAVKVLGKSKANGQEFINEVSTIGRIHHFNVVRLIGYCAERSKRALVYDYMSNGSLEKYIFSQEGNISLSYEKMYEISLGVARGIEYLHRGCDMQILHFDIKPHNILLDENFAPKVSDFGLAKLYRTDDSIVSLTAARGTMGYMAPELFYKNIGGVSFKADVYSFGMLLMEMAGRRKNLNVFADHPSQIYFPSWAYDQFNAGNDIEIGEATEVERVMVKKMIIVALWCIQMRPNDRPSMNKVVEMLEGDIELLRMPPKPFLCPGEMPVEDHEIHRSPTDRVAHTIR